jgi:hypothetical protein
MFWGTEVRAQAMPLRGTLVTNSVINTGRVSGQDSNTTIVYTTPTKGHFVLTQVGSSVGCGSTLIFFEDVIVLGTLDCSAAQFELTFSPGLSIPQGVEIGCEYFASCTGSSCPSCYVTGVLEK